MDNITPPIQPEVSVPALRDWLRSLPSATIVDERTNVRNACRECLVAHFLHAHGQPRAAASYNGWTAESGDFRPYPHLLSVANIILMMDLAQHSNPRPITAEEALSLLERSLNWSRFERCGDYGS